MQFKAYCDTGMMMTFRSFLNSFAWTEFFYMFTPSAELFPRDGNYGLAVGLDTSAFQRAAQDGTFTIAVICDSTRNKHNFQYKMPNSTHIKFQLLTMFTNYNSD